MSSAADSEKLRKLDYGDTYEEYRAMQFRYHQFVLPMTREEWEFYNRKETTNDNSTAS